MSSCMCVCAYNKPHTPVRVRDLVPCVQHRRQPAYVAVQSKEPA